MSIEDQLLFLILGRINFNRKYTLGWLHPVSLNNMAHLFNCKEAFRHCTPRSGHAWQSVMRTRRDLNSTYHSVSVQNKGEIVFVKPDFTPKCLLQILCLQPATTLTLINYTKKKILLHLLSPWVKILTA